MAEKKYRLRRLNNRHAPSLREETIHVVHSQAELRLYLSARACQCGGKLGTRRKYRSQLRAAKGKRVITRVIDRYVTVCRRCRDEVQFAFDISEPVTNPKASLPYVLNPTSKPSEVIDAGHWLNLAYGYFEAALEAQFEGDPTACRDLALTAAAAIEEVLKFYPEGRSLPPTSAFFTPDSLNNFQQQSQLFHRDVLRGLRDVYRQEAKKSEGQSSALDNLLSSVLD